MQPTRPSVAQYQMDALSLIVLSIVRILIASYFLATATGLVLEPTKATFLDALFPHDVAILISTVYLFITAFSIMVGFAVRPAALLLAVYVFWSGFLEFEQSSSIEALSNFWRDMALLGSLLLVALTQPGGNKRFRLLTRRIRPRRINRARLRAIAERRARPARASDALTREDILQGVQFVGPLADTTANTAPLDDQDDDLRNLFDDAWDTGERQQGSMA